MTFLEDWERKMTAAMLIRTLVVIIVIGILLGLVHYFLAALIPGMIIRILDIVVIGGIIVYLLFLLLRAVGVNVV